LKLNSVGDVVARREYYLLNEDHSDEEVIVLIGRPQAFPDARDFYCPYQIIGSGEEGVKASAGVDALQALQLALGTIKCILELINERHNNKLRWRSDNDSDLGLGITSG
jgi:hypothetical protein